MQYIKMAAVTFAAVCCMSDLLSGKITNRLWLAGTAGGLVLNTLLQGWPGVRSSLSGWFLPLAAGFLLFHFRMAGAGDLKELSALGAIAGLRSGLRICIISVVFGAGISCAVLLTELHPEDRLVYFAKWTERRFLRHEKIPYRKMEKAGALPEEFHFAVPVYMAVLLYAGGIL